MFLIADETFIFMFTHNATVLYFPRCWVSLCSLAYQFQYLSISNIEFIELFAQSGRVDGKLAVEVNELRELYLAVFSIPNYKVIKSRIGLNNEWSLV